MSFGHYLLLHNVCIYGFDLVMIFLFRVFFSHDKVPSDLVIGDTDKTKFVLEYNNKAHVSPSAHAP